MYAVAGVTGNTGSIVANTLLERGEKVRVIVRDEAKCAEWKQRGAEVAVASLEDADALASAFAGTKGAYVLLPPRPAAQDVLAEQEQVSDAIAAAVRQSGIPHVVLLSSVGAQHEKDTGPVRALHSAEKKLREAAPRATFLRAPYFMENFLPLVGAAKNNGALPSFFDPSRRIAMASVADIGHTAAEALLDPPADGVKIIELSGPQEYSVDDVAKILGVGTMRVPSEQIAPLFQSFGFSESMANLYREMNDNIDKLTFDGTGVPARGTREIANVVAQ